MFYTKEKINDSMEVSIEITDENVFTRCPVCGKEFSVDLVDILGDGECDLYGTAVLCDECSQEVLEGLKDDQQIQQ